MAPVTGMPVVFLQLSASSVEDATLIGWDHVLDVDEGILSSVGFEHFEGLLDEVS